MSLREGEGLVLRETYFRLCQAESPDGPDIGVPRNEIPAIRSELTREGMRGGEWAADHEAVFALILDRLRGSGDRRLASRVQYVRDNLAFILNGKEERGY